MIARVRELLIKVNQTPVGYLTKQTIGTGRNKYVFTYLPDTDPDNAVSVTMPVRKESYVTNFMHPIFEMSQPEGLLKDYLVSRFGKIMSMDEMGLLFLTGRSRIGSVTAELDLENSDRELMDLAKLVNQKHETERITDNDIMHAQDHDWEPLFDRLLEDFALQSGVGGMQPKVLADIVERAPDSDGRLTANSVSHIVKTSDKDYPFLALNESLCLAVAKKAGLAVPCHRISDNGQVIIIDRFDINEDGSRMGFEDGCVLQGKVADDKYDSSLEHLAESVMNYIPRKNWVLVARELFILVAVNVLVRNGDAHLKNFAIMYNDKDEAIFAKTYDITTTRAYASLRDDIPALMMQNTKRWPTKKELVRFGREACLLKEKDCNKIIDGVIDAVIEVGQTLPSVIDNYPGSEPVCTAMAIQWNDAIKSLYYKKEKDKKKIDTGLDEVEKKLFGRVGDPYQLQVKPAKTLRQENSLRMPKT